MPPLQFLFPETFRWGTATSSYQVEGHITNNDWWKAAQDGGFIYQNQVAGIACDWWNRAEEDFDRMADMGQNAHRLSIEWSRVEPEPGVWDKDAIHRYREMVSGLVNRGIEPMITLHHFTNPLWMVEKGGWENPESVEWFTQYARQIIYALGDLTPIWCTINEPAVMLSNAYGLGRWPPGKRSLRSAIQSAIHVAQAHAKTYHLLHEFVPNPQVGFAKHMIVWEPYRWWMPTDVIGMVFIRHFFNRLFLHLVLEGILRVPGKRPLLMPTLRNTTDWLGVNYYQRYRIFTNLLGGEHNLFLELKNKPNFLGGPGGWGEIHAYGLFDILARLWKRYRLPIRITENGIPDALDEHRPAFIANHLKEIWRAINLKVPVEGYYFWSLLDNYEWTEGYDPRFKFGLFEVDFQTQERRLRQSGHLYQAICQAGGITQEIIHRHLPTLSSHYFTIS